MIKEQARHFPVRPFDRNARPRDLLARGEGGGASAVYRFYAHGRQPLYIGVSSCLSVRLADHRRTSPWWSLAEYIAVSCYRSHKAAEAAEVAAIMAERPIFNRQGMTARTRMEIRFEDGAESIAAELHRIASPDLVRDLARLLAAPELFPTPVAPPPPCFDGLAMAPVRPMNPENEAT
ncbi:GIY-YIG nuclease family protein [Streptomyces sp. NPDC051104]|uniref:GIY-YIG nuclease family protein n=1 Tax=Streptomyces sp. NPDC051104 TaxID=3155044 RepID=UPI003418AE58